MMALQPQDALALLGSPLALLESVLLLLAHKLLQSDRCSRGCSHWRLQRSGPWQPAWLLDQPSQGLPSWDLVKLSSGCTCCTGTLHGRPLQACLSFGPDATLTGHQEL